MGELPLPNIGQHMLEIMELGWLLTLAPPALISPALFSKWHALKTT